MGKINDHIVLLFLLSPRFRIGRYLILFLLIAIICINAVWYLPEENGITQNRLVGFLIYVTSIYGLMCFNIKYLVPKYLLKNKLAKYFLMALIITILIVVIFSVTQHFLLGFSLELKPKISTLARGLITTSSSVISILLIYVGSTSLFLFKHWIDYNQRIEELESVTLQSELKLLKNQINPHFLFNMLNNANIMVSEDADEAALILLKLEDMLRYQINDSAREKVDLSADITFLSSFLDLEKIRRDRFDFFIYKEESVNNIQIPPLLFITFVENAIKHSLDSKNSSYVNLFFEIKENELIFRCENSKPIESVIKEGGGLGLNNIKRRLDLLYGNNYSLEIEDAEEAYTVTLNLKL